MIVHVNGFPGVGKRSVASILAKKLDARLIDNHLVIDLAAALSDRGSERYFSLIDRLTAIILAEIGNEPQSTVIFTNALTAELPEDRSRLERLIEFSKQSERTFVQILLECTEHENRSRIASVQRAAGKLSDADQISQIRREFTIYHPEGRLSFRLDTTEMSPEDAADAIAEYIALATKNLITD